MTLATSPRIAVYGQAGAPYHHIAAFSRNGYDTSVVFAADIRAGALAAFDIFVVPGGGSEGMTGQIAPLGRRGAAAVAAFVRSGGMYLGSCAGAYDAASPAPYFQRTCPAQPLMSLLPARVWNEDPEWRHGLRSPGVGLIRVRNELPDHPVLVGLPAEFLVVHYNGPIFTHATSLLSVAGATGEFTPSEEFLGQPGDTSRIIATAAADGLSVAVAGRFGDGRVVLFGCHPEFGYSPVFLDDDQVPVRMLINAAEWQRAERPPAARPAGPVRSGPGSFRAGSGASELGRDARSRVIAAVDLVRAEVAALRGRMPDRPWLSPAYAMSIFGRSAAATWRAALDGIPRLLDEIESAAPGLPPATLAFDPPRDRPVDFGYAGVLPLLARAAAMLGQARASWDVNLGAPVADPYGFIKTSPYHLVAGSYLAATGHVAGAALLCRCPPERVHA
jgi:hypothetical protein